MVHLDKIREEMKKRFAIDRKGKSRLYGNREKSLETSYLS